MHHRRIRGRLLFLPALDLLAVTLNQFRFGPKGRVHGELPVVYEEMLGAVSVLEPSDSLFCHAIFVMLPGGPSGKAGFGYPHGAK